MPGTHIAGDRASRKRSARPPVAALALALALAMTAGLGLAFGPAAFAQISERLDANGDGFMDQKEAQDSALAKFQSLDVNRDGLLSGQEMGLAQGASNPLDRNADGIVGFDEYWFYFGNVFNTADSNRDGRLSPAELEAMRATGD